MAERENIPWCYANRNMLVRNCEFSCNSHIKMMEYARLRSLVPSVASKSRVSKIQVIEEAIKYIALLQQALRTQPDTAVREVTQENISQQTTQTRPKSPRSKRRRIASYMIKAQRHTSKTRPKSTKSTMKKRTRLLRI